MGDTTTNRGYRKPSSTDDPVNLTSFWRNMADDIDADVALILAQRGIPIVPTTTSSNGTVTSGTTATRDATLGNYVFTALAGVRYMVMLLNAGHQPTVSGDRFSCKTLYTTDGSTPDSSDTEAGADTTWITQGTDGTKNFVVPHITTFIPGAGTITMSMFYTRVSGTGTVTPTGVRQFFVQAIGTV